MARDPDHAPVIYALAVGDARRFTIEASSGTITYTGSPTDLDGTPRRYVLTVTARDTGRLMAEAIVVVTVGSVDKAPKAVDDVASRLSAGPTAHRR